METHALTSTRVLGCILGGALGDAWGGPWEGRTGPVAFLVPEQSYISDDTQLTVATCESIMNCSRIEPEHLASHFASWFAAGRISGIGASTLKAMRDLVTGVHWALAGNRGEFSAGNGAAMRIAPLAFLLDTGNVDDRRLIRDVCRITHHHEEAYIGALAVAVAIRSVLAGTWSKENNFLRIAAQSLPDSAVRDRIEELLPLQQVPKEVARFGSSGWVVDTAPLALYCAQFIAELPLSKVIAQAIEAGGDTDTIASITGQIAGTVSGFEPDCAAHFSQVSGSKHTTEVAVRFADFLYANKTKADLGE